MYATGRGIKADPVEAGRWHLIAKAGGDNDQFLDEFMRNMKPDGSGHGREQGQALDRAHGSRSARPPFPTAPPRQTKSQPVKP